MAGSAHAQPSGIKPGTLLPGGWVVELPLRSGPTGVELRCHHQDDPTRKAGIKLFRDTYPDAWRRFQREAHILTRIHHPTLLRAEVARLDATPPYLVLHLREGPDLRALIEGVGSLPMLQVLCVGRDLANLLAHLHARAIYHRDLQPANVLLTDSGPLVVQMGIAREEGFGVLTNPGTRLGDVRYAPPEWASPEQLRPQQWDLYALGLTLLALFTGQEPFVSDPGLAEADRAVRLTKQKRATPFLDPGPALPDDVRELIRALTAVDPAQRPATAREVHFRLRELISIHGGDPSASAGPPPPVPEVVPSLDVSLVQHEPPPPTLIPASARNDPSGPEEAELPGAPGVLPPQRSTPITPYIAAATVVVLLAGSLGVLTLAAILTWLL